MTDPTRIAVPPRMAHLKRDKRGYPIFYMAHLDKDGRPHFTINDEVKRQRVIRHDLCSICGLKLLRGRWFIGGPGSAFHADGAYLDPPMHVECLHYALEVCPYLAMPRYSKYIEATTLAADDPLVTNIDPNVDDRRPDVFVAVMARRTCCVFDEIVDPSTGLAMEFIRFVKPGKPFIRIEYWQHGRQLSEAEGAALAAQWTPKPRNEGPVNVMPVGRRPLSKLVAMRETAR